MHARTLTLVSLVALCGTVLFAPSARAGQLLATGQTVSYPADKANDLIDGLVPVPDDGALQWGATLKYQLLKDGTVKDLSTGLIWEVKCDCPGSLHDVNNVYFWSSSEETVWDWLKDINAEGGKGYAGHHDWRIPNVRELESLVEFSQVDPRLNPIFGPTHPLDGRYWTSTTEHSFPQRALTIEFRGTTNSHITRSVKQQQYLPVRAVRGRTKLPATGQTTAYQAVTNESGGVLVDVPDDGTLHRGAKLKYKLQKDGTVKDLNTGLIWEVKCNCPGTLHNWNDGKDWTRGAAVETIWDWLDGINVAGYAGHNDWRIPNARELLSIIDYGKNLPAINPIFGLFDPNVTYTLTSTTYAFDPTRAWAVFSDGTAGGGFKDHTPGFVHAVRGGKQ